MENSLDKENSKKDKKVNVFKVYKKIIREMNNENRLLLPLILVSIICSVVINYYPVVFQKTIVTELVNKANQGRIIHLVLFYVLVMIVSSLMFFYTSNYVEPRCTLLRINYLTKLLVKNLKMDYRYVEDPKFSDEFQSAHISLSGNNNGLEYLEIQLLRLPPIIISIAMLMVLIGRHSLIILIGLFVSVILSFIVKDLNNKMGFDKKDELSLYERKVQTLTYELTDLKFGKDLRIFGLIERLKAKLRLEMDNVYMISRQIANKTYPLSFILKIVMVLVDLLVYGILIKKTRDGMGIADFTMCLTAVMTLNLLLNTLVNSLTKVLSEARYVELTFNMVERNLNTDDGKVDKIYEDPLEIEFKNVSFKYPGTDAFVYENLNFKIEKGERIAIVGVNGAGKTTLVKLILGLFKVNEGEVLINGINVNDYKKEALFKMFSPVFQDVTIMPFDIRSNIEITKNEDENIEKENEKRIWEVLEKVDLKDKIEGLENKLDTKVNKSIYDDATDFSGGEAQKLSIARALYKDSNMVIMDEPTSALDALAEQEIYNNFNDLIKNKTALYISHRLASTKFLDRIILLKDKQICEMGNHDELMNLKGEYYNMFKVQGKYYNQDNKDNKRENK